MIILDAFQQTRLDGYEKTAIPRVAMGSIAEIIESMNRTAEAVKTHQQRISLCQRKDPPGG
jgi:hypothetical protein